MNNVEFTLIVQDERNVRARRDDGAEASAQVEPDRLHRNLIDIFEDWVSRGMINKRRELEAFGMLLYRTLFSGQVETFFKQTLDSIPKGERVRVQLSFQDEAADLASLPWEYLYCPDKETRAGFFLSTHLDLVLSRYMPLEKGRQSLERGESPLRILIVVCKPENLGPVVAEPVIEAIQRLDNIKVDILDKPTIDKFLGKLKETNPHVLHFIGHGRFDKAERKSEIALLGPDEQNVAWVRDREFTEFFVQMRSTPRLVFLHLCEGAAVDFNAKFAGLAVRGHHIPQGRATSIPQLGPRVFSRVDHEYSPALSSCARGE